MYVADCAPPENPTAASLLKNSNQARRFLARRGCSFEPGKGGRLIVRREGRMSVLPQHGGAKELGTGFWKKILKDLEIKD